MRVRSSVVCISEDRLLVVRYNEPGTGRNFVGPPGGGVEPEESPEAAARREVLEETGYRVELLPGTHFTLRYPFQWAGKVHDCYTHWYGARLADPEAPPVLTNDADFIVAAEWIPLTELENALAYSTPILEAVKKLTGSRER